MKLSNSSISILIAALSVSTIFVASVFTGRSTVLARARADEPMGSVKPIKGIDIFVECNGCKPHWQARTLSDDRGGFTVDATPPGLYQVSLQCNARCQSMNELDAGTIQLTLTGAIENPFKRNITKQQLVDGVKFPFEIGKEQQSSLRGIVSLLK
jgi:hypothetical protein